MDGCTEYVWIIFLLVTGNTDLVSFTAKTCEHDDNALVL